MSKPTFKTRFPKLKKLHQKKNKQLSRREPGNVLFQMGCGID